MRRHIKVLLFFIILISINYSVYGVIAYPYPVQITQPDGTKITVILKGDEHVKWAQTIDGYSIMRNSKGIYEYAVIDSKNDMVPSGILVRNLSDRSSSDNQFLGRTRKGLTYSKSQIGMIKSISKMYEKGEQKAFPTTGSRKLICILIGFQDKAFTKTQADFNNLFNQVGYTTGGATGSVKDYYAENSYNQLDLTVTVAGPFTAANNMSYYGANDAYGNDIRPRELVTEAVNLADPTVNFADFDNDGNGTVDGVYVIYAGYGEEAGGGADCIWAHAWSITPVVKDGVTISSYSCSAELSGNSGTTITGIGVICHEFGHVMGAMDFYDTDYGTNGQYDGTGNWDIMAAGSWNNNGITPAHHNPCTKTTYYGWAIPTVLNSGTGITLTNAEQNSNSFYRINTATSNEYFLIEDRQQQKFDSYIPGHGMIVYHVDENYISTAGNAINAGSHQGMYPVCASATGNPPATYGTINSGGCPFPGTAAKTSFTDATTPNSLSWAGVPTNRYITSITENTSAKTVSFTLVINTTPIAVTGIATITSPTSATLNAQVNANGLSTTVTFEYGTTTGYGSNINGTPNTVSGTAFTGITANLTGLTSNTTYNYRVKAVNSSGTSYGSNMTFTPIVLSLPVTENFDASTLPIGWTTQNTGTGITERWSISNSAIAGGTPYELECDFMPLDPAPGVTRVISPAINTIGVSAITLTFKHFFEDYAPGATIRIQSSKDLVNWTNETWSSASGSGNIGPATINTTISSNLNSATTYIAFVIDGDLWDFDYWYIDDVSLSVACTPPTTQASAFTSSAITTNSMTAGWTRGNGSSVLVVARQGSAVNSDPIAGNIYTANTVFGSGTAIGSGNYVVYNGTGTSVNVTGLSPGTGYYYAIYEYTATKCYKIPALTGNATTTGTGYCTANLGGSGSCPGDITALSITSTTLNNTVHNNCSTANGSTYASYAPSGSNTCNLYVGATYTLNITTTNADIVSLWIDYNQNGSFETTEWTQVSTSTQAGVSASVSFTVPPTANTGQTGLRVRSRLAGNQNGATDACLQFGSGIAEDYTINLDPGCTPPSTQASAFSTSSITNTTMSTGWTRGNGSSVLVVARQGSAVNLNPIEGTTYTANTTFGSGTQIGTGNYVVYTGTGNSVNITNLSQGTTYYFAIYEYSAALCYKIPALTGSAITTGVTTQFTNFQAANIVVGQLDFTAQSTTADQRTTPDANASAVSSKGVLAVATQSSGRILIWNQIPSVNGTQANIIVGKPDFTSEVQGCTQSLTGGCDGICFSPDGNKLIVTDSWNARVLIWNTIPTTNGQAADVVIGQTDFISVTTGCTADKFGYPAGVLVTPDGKLIINDYLNYRVLIFNKIPVTNGASADVVIGQPDMISNGIGSGSNQLGSAWYSAISPDGKLLISDPDNNRVLIFNNIPTTNGASASNVIGQTGFNLNGAGLSASQFDTPVGVTVSPGGKVAIGEFNNNRVVIYNSLPTTNGAAANVVLGQPDFVTNTQFNGGVSAQSMYHPYGINFDLNGRLFVNGRDMNRVMIFGNVPTLKAELALSFSSNSTNLCGGSSVQYILQITNNGPDNASNVIAQAVLPVGFTLDGGIIASSGTYNSTSGWWNIPSIANGSSQTLIFNGKIQPSLTVTAYASIISSEQQDINLANNAASVSVTSSANVAPSIVQQPSNQYVSAGNPAAFNLSATGTSLTYQWQVNPGTGIFANLSNGTTYSGVTTNTLNISSATTIMNNYLYRCVVSGTGPCIAISNAASLTTTGSCITPGTQATSFSATSVTSVSMTANWVRGNGTNVLVVAHQGSAVNSDPVNGTIYSANAAFGNGTQIGSGNYVVYNGTGTAAPVSGLVSGVTYYFAIYEYNSGTDCYKIPALAGNATTTGCTPPTTPAVGTITQPTCAVPTGSVVLNNLPATGTWTLTRTPGGTTTTGTGTSTTITGLAPGTYTFTVTNSSGCTSSSTGTVVINAVPTAPTAPTVGTITQPTCSVVAGSVVLNGLPATGTWTLTRTPGGNTTTGTGTSTTITGIPTGTYTFTVTNASGCTSVASANVVIGSQPETPSSPNVGTVAQPTCAISTGSVVLNNLPVTGTWTLTVTPGGATISGTGTTTTITGLSAGTYIYTVTNAFGCTSSASINVVINTQPPTPSAPTVGTTTQPTCVVATGGVVLSGLPSSGYWTLTRTPGGTITTGTGTSSTISGLESGTYTYKVTNTQGCSSVASANVVINVQPPTPTAPVTGTIVQPKWSVATGSVILTGLPATGTWTLTRTPGGTTTTGTGTSSPISGLAAGTYSYTVTNASGCTSLASSLVGIYAQPPAPSGLIASSCNNLVTLNWKKITDQSFRLYRIYGGTTTNPTTKIDSTTSSVSDTSRVISGLTHGQTYYFLITAVDIGGSESNISNQPNAKVKTGVMPKIRVKWGIVLTCSNLGDSIKSYQWYKDGSAISKANSQYYVTTKKASPYYVETVDLNGCVNTSNTILISGTKSLSVYPNPASVSFALKLNEESDASAEVTILNSAGVKVMKFEVENVNDEILKEIPVNQLKEGTYIVQVLLDHKDLYYTKIVVIK